MIIPHVNNSGYQVWTITEAKARLSELLRLANQEPQYIGTRTPYVLIPAHQWEEVSAVKKPFGAFLVESLAEVKGEIPLPDRNEPEREIPFS